MVTGKIEPCINTVRFLLKTMLETKDVVLGNAVKSTILKLCLTAELITEDMV